MTYSVPSACPACGHDLEVRVLHCPNCDTEINGHFSFECFANLPADQMEFLETFLRCRGNMKAVGTLMGMSYPTTRGRLDSLLDALGFQPLAETEDEGEPEADAPKKRGRRGRKPKSEMAVEE